MALYFPISLNMLPSSVPIKFGYMASPIILDPVFSGQILLPILPSFPFQSNCPYKILIV